MLHLTVGVFGDTRFASHLGKLGTTNDIAIYHHSSSEAVLTIVHPASEKVQPLLQSINMIDVPILVVDQLTKEVGEAIIAIDQMKFSHGFIIGNEDLIRPIIKNTSLEKFTFTHEQAIRQQLLNLNIQRDTNNLVIPIDNYFDVKSIGTVVLGIVKSGIARQYEMVAVEPLGRAVTIKSMQSQDKDVKEAEPGTRLGLSLKGISVDELKRGYVICKKMKNSTDVNIDFTKSNFFKSELKVSMAVFLNVGLQVVPAHIQSIDNHLVLKCLQPVVYDEGQKCIVASQSDVLPRIIGSGTLIM
ncbi:MAG TPA: EF-Tu/IF-2/RF-3 family GTPase [archaeon]|nr:EF-Tu/IF-2/RF-3 family GTPase [archaeon]